MFVAGGYSDLPPLTILNHLTYFNVYAALLVREIHFSLLIGSKQTIKLVTCYQGQGCFAALQLSIM